MKEIRLRFDTQNRQIFSNKENFDFYGLDNIDGRNFGDNGIAKSIFRGPELITKDIFHYFPMIQKTADKLHYALYLLLRLLIDYLLELALSTLL